MSHLHTLLQTLLQPFWKLVPNIKLQCIKFDNLLTLCCSATHKLLRKAHKSKFKTFLSAHRLCCAVYSRLPDTADTAACSSPKGVVIKPSNYAPKVLKGRRQQQQAVPMGRVISHTPSIYEAAKTLWGISKSKHISLSLSLFLCLSKIGTSFAITIDFYSINKSAQLLSIFECIFGLNYKNTLSYLFIFIKGAATGGVT